MLKYIGLQTEFQHCLEKFPELDPPPSLEFVPTEGLMGGGAGHRGSRQVVLLYGPAEIATSKPRVYRPIIFHELAHMIDLEDPDRVFFERADEQSRDLWHRLQADPRQPIQCQVGKEV